MNIGLAHAIKKSSHHEIVSQVAGAEEMMANMYVHRNDLRVSKRCYPRNYRALEDRKDLEAAISANLSRQIN